MASLEKVQEARMQLYRILGQRHGYIVASVTMQQLEIRDYTRFDASDLVAVMYHDVLHLAHEAMNSCGDGGADGSCRR